MAENFAHKTSYIMAKIILTPVIIKAAGNKEKLIEEFFGAVNSVSENLSIARMTSQEGWEEPGQCPEFKEYTVVLKGTLKVSTRQSEYFVKAGQAIMTEANEWVQYSTPVSGGAEYIAVCMPSFSPQTVHRDE
jgi:mannose-6-phosphate isomerase-like protein (cupin superfamily)